MCNITKYVKSGQPGLVINSNEAERVITGTKVDEGYKRYRWDLFNGVIDIETGQKVETNIMNTEGDVEEIETTNPVELLRWFASRSDAVLFAQNFHHMIDSVEVLQMIESMVQVYKSSGCCFVMIGNNVKLPPEIAYYFQFVDFELPDIEQLKAIQQEMATEVGEPIDMASIEAAKGLTEFEAETAFALSLVEKKKFCAQVVIENKKAMIKRSGIMEFHPPVSITELGGLKNLKDFVWTRKKAFEPGSKLPRIKGILLVGVAGCGKSLSAKVIASILDWPLIRMDLASFKGSLVGQTEENCKKAMATADAFGSAVIWWDEIEKALSGVGGKHGGDTTESMFGLLLTWMQETKSQLLIVATANAVDNLPAPFLRAGRFDAIFMVDTPTLQERIEIVKIMDARYGSEIEKDFGAEDLNGYTGAEIEQIAKDSLFDGVETAVKNVVPIVKTKAAEVKELREWAKGKARRANTDEKPFRTVTKSRKVNA